MSSSPYTQDGKIDRTDLYWLVYLVFFLIEPVERRSLHYWAETLVILTVFLTLYLVFLKRGKLPLQIALIGGMVALGAATLPINDGAAAFIIYAAALVPFVVTPPTWVLSTVVFLAALVGAECLLLHFQPWATFLNVFFTLVVGSTNLHFAQKHRSDCKLRMQSEEIEALAAVAERERIARDLHDVLGHTLSVIVLKSELANRLLQRELASLASSTNPSPQPEAPLPTLSPQPEATLPTLSSRPEAALPTMSSRPEAEDLRGETCVPAATALPQDEPAATALSRVAHPLRSKGWGEPAATALPQDEPAATALSRVAHPLRSKGWGEPAATAPDLSTLQRAQTEIADVERTARTALAEVREAIGGYRARGLAAEINAARQTLASANVILTTEGDLHPATLTAAEETVLALALREAVTNIVRHARASTCRLRLVNDGGRHQLSIQDNGHHPTSREGNGLRGMRERVEALGGQLHLTRDSGTHLQIDLPHQST